MKALRIFLFILIVIGVILLCTQKYWVSKLVNQIISYQNSHVAKEIPVKPAGGAAARIAITSVDIKEENFKGTVAKISGTSVLAIKSQAYINQTVAEFRKQANADVPAMRKQFGADSPTAMYEIDIGTDYLKSAKTESIVMTVYTYTGGAHGSSVYKAITVSIPGDKFLPLSSVIKAGQESAFTAFVKNKLNTWKPEGSDAPVVFPDDVNALTFNSFANWSLSDTNLTIYFDQYAIGPGVLGEVAFPLPISELKDFMN